MLQFLLFFLLLAGHSSFAGDGPKVEKVDVPQWGTLSISDRGVSVTQYGEKMRQLRASERRRASFGTDGEQASSKRESSPCRFATGLILAPSNNKREGLLRAKAHFYDLMVHSGHWTDSKQMAELREQYHDALENRSKRLRALRSTAGKTETKIYHRQQRLLNGGLDRQQKAFLRAEIDRERANLLRSTQALKLVEESSPQEGMALIKAQAEQYGHLFESMPKEILGRDGELHRLQESINALELEVAKERFDL